MFLAAEKRHLSAGPAPGLLILGLEGRRPLCVLSWWAVPALLGRPRSCPGGMVVWEVGEARPLLASVPLEGAEPGLGLHPARGLCQKGSRALT